jgi:hypothetical protein
VEFINVAKDDALAWPRQARRAYPVTVQARMESTITPFVCKSLAVSETLLKVFNTRLELPEGALIRRHSLEEFSGSETRCIRNPPKPDGSSPTAIGSHTDFGSLVRVFEHPWKARHDDDLTVVSSQSPGRVASIGSRGRFMAICPGKINYGEVREEDNS